MTKDTQHIAVLTGDLVHSTELGPKGIEAAFGALQRCAEDQENWYGKPLHFTRHRGDGWQVALAKPEYALRSALTVPSPVRNDW